MLYLTSLIATPTISNLVDYAYNNERIQMILTKAYLLVKQISMKHSLIEKNRFFKIMYCSLPDLLISLKKLNKNNFKYFTSKILQVKVNDE